MMGKIPEWFPHLENIYIPPTPHDGGLTLGAAQYVWHQQLDNERIAWSDNFTPYLGKTYPLRL
jgi:predicted NodU family carbamoyl transferase